MSTVSCRVARAQLAARHDDELGLDQQVTLEAHASGCPSCAAVWDELGVIRTALRRSAARHVRDEDNDGFARVVLGQVHAERRTGWWGRAARVIDEAPQLWVAGGAVVSTTAYALLVASVLSMAAPWRPDSLSGVLEAKAALGSNISPMMMTRGVTMPSVSNDGHLPVFLTGGSPMLPESAVALAAVVTREGVISHMEVLRAPADGIDLYRELARLASDMRFVPARSGGVPVAVNLIWLLERTTVHGNAPLVTPDRLSRSRG